MTHCAIPNGRRRPDRLAGSITALLTDARTYKFRDALPGRGNRLLQMRSHEAVKAGDRKRV